MPGGRGGGDRGQIEGKRGRALTFPRVTGQTGPGVALLNDGFAQRVW